MTTPPDALSKGCERLAKELHRLEVRWLQGADATRASKAAVLASSKGLAGLVEIVVEKSEHRCCCGGKGSCIPCRARAAIKEFVDGMVE